MLRIGAAATAIFSAAQRACSMPLRRGAPHVAWLCTEVPESVQTAAAGAEDRTPLVDELEATILMRGPLTMADFMRHSLRHPLHGYYMQHNVFGRSGDFVTSPEISPLFGEHIAFWCILQWERLGKPSELHLIEVGPGTGKLMADMLRISARMPDFHRALRVHMVDVSPALKLRQAKALGCIPPEGAAGPLTTDLFSGSYSDEAGAQATLQVPMGPRVSWYPSLSSVPPMGPNVIIAHELFDALPVHQFVFTPEGWREQCIDVDEGTEGGHHFKYVTSPHVTPALAAFLGISVDATAAGGAPSSPLQAPGGGPSAKDMDTVHTLLSGGDEADLSAANDLWASVKAVSDRVGQLEQGSTGPASPLPSTPSDDPAANDTYAALRHSTHPNKQRMAEAEVGDVVEFSPSSAGLAYEIASRVSLFGGGALMIDYGHNHASGASVRGIKGHKFVSPLAFPGRTDLSVDVDFSQLAHAASTAGGVEVHGPVTQSEFLQRLGIVERLQQVLDNGSISEGDKQEVMGQVERLVSPDAMGDIYKVLAFASPPPNPDDALDGLAGFPPSAEEEEEDR